MAKKINIKATEKQASKYDTALGVDHLDNEQSAFLSTLSKIDRHNVFDVVSIELRGFNNTGNQSLETHMTFSKKNEYGGRNIYAELTFFLHPKQDNGFEFFLHNLSTRPIGDNIAPHILNVIYDLEKLFQQSQKGRLEKITGTAMLSHGPLYWPSIGFTPAEGYIEHFCNMCDCMNYLRYRNKPEHFEQFEDAIIQLRENQTTANFWAFIDNKKISHFLLNDVRNEQQSYFTTDGQIPSPKFNTANLDYKGWGYSAVLRLNNAEQRMRFDRYMVRGMERYFHTHPQTRPAVKKSQKLAL